jgi:pimeloyl-ACP methyl ester carboxylesterase
MSKGAQPVLFLHGAWHGPWVWEEWMPLFRQKGYDAQAVTLRGHGRGENGYRGVGLEDYRHDVEALIEQLSTTPVLIGHSLGGLLIQYLLADWRLPAVVLVAPIPGRYPPGIILRNTLRHPWAMTKSTVRNDLAPLVGTPELVREVLFTPGTPAEVISRCQRQLMGAWPGLFREMVTTAPPDPLPGTPALLLAPQQDSSFTVGMQRKLAEKLDAELRIIPGSGHNLPLDSPWRVAAQTTLSFLARHAPAPALHDATDGARVAGWARG